MNQIIKNLLPATFANFERCGHNNFTSIQESAIPEIMAGKDLVGLAKTGSGKTAAFLLPILEIICLKKLVLNKGEVSALILTPTRELASQIETNAFTYSEELGLKIKAVFGGVSKSPQVFALEMGVDLLIATPGRLLDLLERGHINFARLEVLVLDEADMMLDMGFLADVQKIIDILPIKKQTLLFSATMPKAIEALATTYLKMPVQIEVDDKSAPSEHIEQKLYTVEKANKVYLLQWLFENLAYESILIFCKTKFGAERIVEAIERSGVSCASLHSQKTQGAREAALAAFKMGDVRVLVATDIAARGIDINDVSLVINYNLPEDPRNYIHRIGRTGRAGKTGLAISFCVEAEVVLMKSIGKLIGTKINIDSSQPFHKEISFAYKDTTKAKKSKKKRRKG